ncbi:MAG: CRISPR-associated endonuclease Cas1 [Candidatus Heimdallarchaeota archaeon]|nr:CRISPR-associated endonuclease Cas1 [Candidatus Heimdallarchaeota archaeon]
MVDVVLVDHGAYVQSEGDNFLISFGGSTKPKVYVPVVKTESILVDCKASFTSGAFDLIAKYGIPVVWNSLFDNGMVLIPYGTNGSAEIRRSQYLAATNTKSNQYATSIVSAAIRNKANLLSWLGRYRNIEISENRTKIRNLIPTTKNLSQILDEERRNQLMTLEAQAAKLYFQELTNIIPERYNFKKRTRRPATDIFSALLNYGYAVLKGKITMATIIVGMDIYAGFLHVDRSGRESFVLDAIEEFRQICIDVVAIELLIQEKVEQDHIEVSEDNAIQLTKELKKLYLQKIYEKFEEIIEDKTLFQWMIYQTREASKFFRGQIDGYQPFIFKVK